VNVVVDVSDAVPADHLGCERTHFVNTRTVGGDLP
jgi:hypothetical protein